MSIEIKNVNYLYSQGTSYEMHALKNVNLEIPDGQFVGLIGHTGSGKSTLTQHLNGLVKATSGHIYYNGEDIYDEKGVECARHEVNPASGIFGVQVPAGMWHTLIVHEPSVIIEMKEGAYVPITMDDIWQYE